MEEDKNLPCSSFETIRLDTAEPPHSGSCLSKNVTKTCHTSVRQLNEFQILHIKWSQIACGIACSTVLLRLGVQSFFAEGYLQPVCRRRRGAYMMEPPPRLYMTCCCLTGRYVVMCLLNWLNKHYAPACQPCCSSFSSLCVLCLLPAAVILSSAASFSPIYFNYLEQTQTHGLKSMGEVCPPPFC